MRVLEGPPSEWSGVVGRGSVTIGVFDGVHVGHRSLISRLIESSVSTLLTFDPHPIEVLRPGTHARLITTLEERLQLLEQTGLTQVGVLDLNDVKEQPAEDFVAEVLVGSLAITSVFAGPDFRFGKDRGGDIEMLHEMGKSGDFSVEVIDEVADRDGVVSSSRIRGLIEDGHVRDASILLQSNYSLANTVIDGDKRGREIGFPTANLRSPDRKVVPGRGVYAGYARFDGETHEAAVNVGVRPTFGGGELLIEAFLLDYSGDLYGRDLTVEFVEYLRPELEFGGVDELVNQMTSDVQQTREVLGSAPPNVV